MNIWDWWGPRLIGLLVRKMVSRDLQGILRVVARRASQPNGETQVMKINSAKRRQVLKS